MIQQHLEYLQKQEAKIDRQYKVPNNLEFFALETRQRKVIAELIRPLNQDMEAD